MGAVLEGAPGADAPSATAMRASLAVTGTTPQHCLDVLTAFRWDATNLRYKDWAELMEYCRYSASPVGRQLLDLHGESRATWPASDALCSALQVLNHLQDCAEDYRNLDRVYLPETELTRYGGAAMTLSYASPEQVAGEPQSTAGLRCVLDRLLDQTDGLIQASRALPPGVKSPGLKRECAVIVGLARRLARRLRHGDPLAMRVKLSRGDFALALLRGLIGAGR